MPSHTFNSTLMSDALGSKCRPYSAPPAPSRRTIENVTRAPWSQISINGTASPSRPPNTRTKNPYAVRGSKPPFTFYDQAEGIKKLIRTPTYDPLMDPHLQNYYQRLWSAKYGDAGSRKKPKRSPRRQVRGLEGIVYTVTTKTGDKSGGGTNARVYITLLGDDNESQRKRLTSKNHNFARGCKDVFEILVEDVGRLKKIKIEHDGTTRESSWFLDYVSVKGPKGAAVMFPCNNWLSIYDGDGKRARILRHKTNSEFTNYEVTVETGDRRGAGTDANVYVQLFSRGKSGRKAQDTGRLKLSGPKMKNTFERGSEDHFIVKAKTLPKLSKLRIGHDNSGFSPGWFLDRVRVRDPNARRVTYFNCRKWLSREEGDGQITRDITGTDDPDTFADATEYKIRVYTGKKRGAGTDANVSIILFGEDGDSGVRKLDNNKNNFERGMEDEFVVESADLGKLRKVRIGHDNSGVGPGWFLDRIDVEDLGSGKVYEFPCSKWLSKSEDDGKVSRELFSKGSHGNNIPMTVHVFTGKKRHAGTDANVFITIYGTEGSTGEIALKEGTGNKFEKGQTDIFHIDTEDIGELEHLRVWHDNSGIGPGWFLHKVVTDLPTYGLRYTFGCDEWLSKDEGDGKIERELEQTDVIEYEPKQLFRITTFTGDKKHAGTDANVFLYVYGKKGKSDKVPLKTSSDSFKRNQEDVFEVDIDDVGKIYKIRIGHDGSGLGDGWFLDHVEMLHVNTGFVYEFSNDRWLARDEDDGEIERELPAEGDGIKSRSLIKYIVKIKTGKKRGAGTDANVYMTAFGKYGDTGVRELRKSLTYKNKFEKNQEDVFELEAVDLGKLDFVRIGHDGSNLGSGWYLDDVTIENSENGKVTMFPCHRWLDRSEDDGLIERELPASDDDSGLARITTTSYHLSVKTGNIRGAGTDANVFVQLYDKKHDSGEILLKRSRNNRSNKFERGKIDVFVLESMPFSKIEKIRIGHDGTGIGAGWFLDELELDVPSIGRTYFFPCDRWLASDEDDGEIERVLYPDDDRTVEYPPRFAWELRTFTGDIRGAGTDAKVHIQVYGEHGKKTPPIGLHNKSNCFERGAADAFKIEIEDIGQLSKLRVWHDASGFGDGWFLERFEMINSTTDEIVSFNCNRWLATDEDDGEIVRELPAESDRPLPIKNYTVRTVTGSKRGAGTDANVYLELFGKLGDTGRRFLKNRESNRNKFERKQEDVFSIEACHLGKKIEKIRIGHDGTGIGAGWFLDRVEVVDEDTGKVFEFPCNRWLAKDEDDGQIQRELIEGIGCANIGMDTTTYHVEVHTGDKRGAGTDANVVLTMYGREGDSGPVPLARSANNKNKFERSQVDLFDIECVDLGKLRYIHIEHDGKGIGAGWFLSKIVIEVPSTGRRYIFEHNRWLDLNEDNGEIGRDIKPTDVEKIKKRIPWELIVSTGDKRGAGTDANMYFILYGEEGKTDTHKLKNESDNFERGKSDAFKVECDDVGRLYKMRVWHDNKGASPGWFLDKIELQNVHDEDNCYKFKCGRWLAKDEDDGEIVRELPAKRKGHETMPLRTYSILVVTSDKRRAGTDANVFVNLFGKYGDTGERQLFKSESHTNKFERNNEDTFLLEAVKLGKLSKCRIGHDGTGFSSKWHLSFVKVKEEETGKEWMFPCDRWLAKDEDDGLVVRELMPADENGDVPVIPTTSYHVSITTGDVRGAGTDANVFITLYGKNGDTGKVKLTKSESWMDKFERAKTDKFSIEAIELGDIERVRIGHDGTKFGSGWFLSTVEVDCPSTGKRWIFSCNRWLDGNEDDGKIVRDLFPDAERKYSYVPSVPYDVTVYTSDIMGAGTDANVYVQLYGKGGLKTNEIHLMNNSNNFEQGQKDRFKIEVMDIGDLHKCRIWHDNKGIGAAWHLEKLVCRNCETNDKYVFYCNRWLARDQDDGEIVRELTLWHKGEETTDTKIYTVHVFTGDVRNAGTDANVSLCLFGEHGDTGTRQLRHSETYRNKFERSNEDVFTLEAANLGELIMCRIGHDNSGFGPGWYLDRVEVDDEDIDKTYNFPCERWLDLREDDQNIVRELACSNSKFGKKRKREDKENEKDTIKVTVKTGDKRKAISKSSISLKLYGVNGNTEVLAMKPHKKWKPGKVEEFEFPIKNIGALKKIKMGHNDSGVMWHCKNVIIENEDTGAIDEFMVDDWFSSKKGDGETMRYIKLSKHIDGRRKPVLKRRCSMDPFTYTVTVVTADQPRCGTDANVFITLYGEYGDSGRRKLAKSDTHRDKFERGNTDIFHIECMDLGKLNKIEIEHDNAGFMPGWLLEEVAVVKEDEDGEPVEEETLFPCNHWLARGKEDGQIKRELLPLPEN